MGFCVFPRVWSLDNTMCRATLYARTTGGHDAKVTGTFDTIYVL